MLTEAALALEAEVQSHPDNAEAWRLLGTVHAENDDDQQVRGQGGRGERRGEGGKGGELRREAGVERGGAATS